MASLTARATGGLAFLVAVLALATFVPAWTLAYGQAWVFLAVFTGATAAITLDLARRDPALLARRVQAGPLAEPERAQRIIQSVASLAFLSMFVIAGLDHRAGWSDVSVVVVAAGDAAVALGLWIVARVFRANTFTSATIEVARAQPLVSTGPYAIVRHPMYAGGIVMTAGVPLALGSWWALLAAFALALAIVVRLLAEERLLAVELAGYAEYRRRVRHRLVPYVW